MKYSSLAGLYEKLDSTSKRLEKTYFLSEFLKTTSAEEIESVLLLVQGRVFPSYDEREIGVANQLVIKAISLASGATGKSIEKEWAKKGDLGIVAESLLDKKSQSTLYSKELSVKKVFDNLRKLTELTGSGSVDRKLQLIAELLSSAKGVEARYIIRTVLGQLRVGTGAGIIRDAIAWAYFPKATAKIFVKCDSCGKTVPPAEKCVECGKEIGKAASEELGREEYNAILDKIQSAYDLTNDFSVVAKKAKVEGIAGLEKVEIKIGNPIKVMLALKSETLSDALETVGRPCQCEYKYDGFRLECHKSSDGKVWLYTRRLENVTEQFPEVAGYLKEKVKGESYILDTEAVGFDPKTQKYVPFQNISQRIKRKYDIDEIAKELPVEVNVFDILSYEGKNLTSEPFQKRRQLVEKIVRNSPREIVVSTAIVSGDETEIEQFFSKAKAAGTEGLMLKKLDAPYQPGARVGYMLKYKKVMENLDLVIVAAEWGEGKRSKWLSSYTLACNDNGTFREIGKVSTGLKEKREEGLSFDEITELLKPIITEQTGRQVIVKPKIILEVAYEEIQKSPTYESGYALRFPRVIRNRTDEKGVDDINTIEDVERIYNTQKKAKG